jgi:exopolyphosphatase/guanosine-5'-triphosphate,3'-diphosphate pyrophosphatase
MPLKRIAAVDLGSLTVRLAVAERLGAGRFRVLRHRREVTALAEGLAPGGALAPGAMERTYQALGGFVREMQAWGVKDIQAVATQALRQAANRETFLRRLQEGLGLAVQILSPEEEARLTLTGVLSALDPKFLRGPVAVFDVGGGSSEFALLLPGQGPRFAGLPLGVLTLSQARPLGDPPDPARVAALKAELTGEFTKFYQEHLASFLTAPPRLVGTAGAVTTLAALALKMAEYDPHRVNNLVLRREQVAALTDELSRLTQAERARLPGMESAKAGVMVAGALIVQTILEVFQQDSLVVSDSGLLEGVLAGLAS